MWLNNARDLITSGQVKLEEAISTRDDIMNYLIAHGVDPLVSFKVMENVRKGKGLEKGDSNNLAKLKEAGIPQWFIESCLKISYLFPRAHAVAYAMIAFRTAWFKVYHPLAYYAAYFSIRAKGAFNAPVILKGLEAQKAELARINSIPHPTAVEKGQCFFIIKRNFERINACQVFQHTEYCGIVFPQYIKFQHTSVKGRALKKGTPIILPS